MGLLKGVGKFAGGAFGTVVGGAACFAGGLVNSKMLQEIGEGVFNSSMKAGETVGGFADGVVCAAAGTAFGDESLRKQGCKEMEEAVVETAVGVGRGVVHVCNNGKLVVEGVLTSDSEKALKGGAELIKTAAIATLAIGVLDIIDIADGPQGVDADMCDAADATGDAPQLGNQDVAHGTIENPNSHFVQAHARVLPSGETIWVDGDGNTGVATQAGWVQHNPDYRVSG